MTENYLQFAGGDSKKDIRISDVQKAIKGLKKADEEHGAFWVSVITDEENVLEVDKDRQMTFVFYGEETKYTASDWDEVEMLYRLLLDEEFDVVTDFMS